MALAVFLSGIMAVIALFSAHLRRNRYASLRCINNTGKVKKRIVRLKRIRGAGIAKNNPFGLVNSVCSERSNNVSGDISGYASTAAKVIRKLNAEIKLFNKLKVVMPCRRGVAVLYSKFLSGLAADSRFLPGTSDGTFKLIYLYAAVNMSAKTGEELVRKQLLKNCIWIFGQKNMIKPCGHEMSFVDNPDELVYARSKQRALFRVKTAQFFLMPQMPKHKLLGRGFVSDTSFEIAGCELKRRDSVSYVTYSGDSVHIKHYADKNFNIKCYEINASSTVKFALWVGADKMKYTLSHTLDTFFAVSGGRNANDGAVGVYVDTKAELGSSICEKTDELRIYISLTGRGNIYVASGANKSEAAEFIAKVKRRGRLDYLCNTVDAKNVHQVEQVAEAAWKSKFVAGNGLREKYLATGKYVPTVFLPMLVYEVAAPSDFFDAVDLFPFFRRIGCGGNLSVVFLYSSQNEEVTAVINAFVNKSDARELIAAGVFLFFIDKVVADARAVNYLSLMAHAKSQESRKLQTKNCDKVEVTVHVSNSFPVTTSVFVRNCLKPAREPSGKKQGAAAVTAQIAVPLEVNGVVVKKGAKIQVTGLEKGARSHNFKLPAGAAVVSDLGREITDEEVVCERVFILLQVKLLPFEEKVFKIIKNDGSLSRRETKEAFIGSLENLKVNAADARLTKLLGLKIEPAADARSAQELLNQAKSAVRNFDKDLFFALFKKAEKITPEFWSFLAEKVIGLRLLKNKIQLLPNVQISGNFELSFTYKNTPYSFSVTERGSGFSVRYSNADYNNFLQVETK